MEGGWPGVHTLPLTQAPAPHFQICPRHSLPVLPLRSLLLLQVAGRWLPPWHVLAGTLLLALSLLHCLAGPLGAPQLERLEWLSLGAVMLCLPRIALRALLVLRRGVSGPGQEGMAGGQGQGWCRASRQAAAGARAAGWRVLRVQGRWQLSGRHIVTAFQPIHPFAFAHIPVLSR